jgi:sulfide:quinone oxidoreductase
VAALEALLALRELAGHQVEITLLAPGRDFVYRPVTVAEAFDRGEARTYPLGAIAADHGARFVWGALESVSAVEHAVLTDSGDRVEFDKLVVATGARFAEALPGGLTFFGRGEVPALRRLLAELVSGEAGSVAFVLPSDEMWPLPLYELALMTAQHLREHGADDVSVSLVTPEARPLGLFGPAAWTAVEALLETRGVTLYTSSRALAARSGSVLLSDGGAVATDRVVALPTPVGPAIPGLPQDASGFVPVDEHGRVTSVDDVFAAGDVAFFPLKQGGLAAQQADAVAETIAAEIGIALRPQPFRPVLRGLLMTGGAPLYVRAEPDRLPRATGGTKEFARAPSRQASAATGQPLWWPPAKIAGRHLAPYLAAAAPLPISRAPLVDRMPEAGIGAPEQEHREAVELTLMLAGLDAQWGDYRSALEALDAAEALEGALPPEYEAHRRRWRAAASSHE